MLEMDIFKSQRWHRALILFTGLFVSAVVTQFAINWYLRREEALRNLSKSAEEIAAHLGYSNRWSLTRLRQAELGTGSYYVMDAKGLSIDIQGFVPELDLGVILDDRRPGLQTVTPSETGETWRLLVQPVSGGIVIVGISPPEDVTDVDKRLKENAQRFGPSLDTAARLEASEIDRNLDYAVVGENQRLKSALGGIPLRIVSSPRFPLGQVVEIPTADGRSVGVLSVPFPKRSTPVGVVTVFDDVPPQPWYSLQRWLLNCLSSGFLAAIGTLIGVPYLGEKFEPRRFFQDAIRRGETREVEFKEALRWDKWNQDVIPGEASGRRATEVKGVAEGIVVKTIAAFLNGHAGGTLLIGVSDQKQIVGIERDYESLAKTGELRVDREKNRDRFQLHLRSLLAGRIGREITNPYVETGIVEVDGKDVCIVHALPSPRPVYVADGQSKTFYVRDGASTIGLDVDKVVAYVEQRWPKAMWRRVLSTMRIR